MKLQRSEKEAANDPSATINNDSQISTLLKLRQAESAAARTKLRRTAELQKNAIELKPCQNVADYQITFKNYHRFSAFEPPPEP